MLTFEFRGTMRLYRGESLGIIGYLLLVRSLKSLAIVANALLPSDSFAVHVLPLSDKDRWIICPLFIETAFVISEVDHDFAPPSVILKPHL